MMIENRSQTNLTSGLTKIVEQVLYGDYSAPSTATDVLLTTAIAPFFPQFKHYGTRTLQLIMDGCIMEVIFPKSAMGTWEIRENNTTITRTKDERAIVLLLATAIAMHPYQFKKFVLEGSDRLKVA